MRNAEPRTQMKIWLTLGRAPVPRPLWPFSQATTAKRQQFANDLTNPQLIAVTDTVNQAKGDKSPDAWKPPLTSYHCTYARMWVKVKSVWELTVTAKEKSALTSMLNTC
ncbi:hypothetical protein FPQ18DRAFT_390884 [Pyronema domesticum]|nr:hypothetical protein FPQ18DRAFT_390884 [Pyronema domesticum]